MTTPTDSAHARTIEDARQALDQAIESAIRDGLNVEVTAFDRTVDGRTFPKAHIRVLVFRRIEL